jgi:hypothetical protein
MRVYKLSESVPVSTNTFLPFAAVTADIPDSGASAAEAESMPDCLRTSRRDHRFAPKRDIDFSHLEIGVKLKKQAGAARYC